MQMFKFSSYIAWNIGKNTQLRSSYIARNIGKNTQLRSSYVAWNIGKNTQLRSSYVAWNTGKNTQLRSSGENVAEMFDPVSDVSCACIATAVMQTAEVCCALAVAYSCRYT
jgi:hypothetical protein